MVTRQSINMVFLKGFLKPPIGSSVAIHSIPVGMIRLFESMKGYDIFL
jgi:hypothetical protein